MASTARRKIDTQTQQMFDVEVDRPEHDQILTSLFNSDSQLEKLLISIHGAQPLLPFTKDSLFKVRAPGYKIHNSQISLAEAVQLTGVTPSWSSLSPVRIRRKAIEVLMNYSTSDRGNYSRLIGFIDLAVAYEVAEYPYIDQTEHNSFRWVSDSDISCALFLGKKRLAY
jgi:hypothetical protein